MALDDLHHNDTLLGTKAIEKLDQIRTDLLNSLTETRSKQMTNLPESIPRLLASLLAESQIVKSAQTMLSSLYYRTIHSRRSAVAQTYEDTY